MRYSKDMPGMIQFKYDHSKYFRYLNIKGKIRSIN